MDGNICSATCFSDAIFAAQFSYQGRLFISFFGLPFDIADKIETAVYFLSSFIRFATSANP